MKKSLLIASFLLLLSSCLPQPNSESQARQTLEIHDIQGCSHQSPYDGQSASGIIGVVTWKVKNGFFMQGLQPDDKACSSEGIFVFTNDYPTVIPQDLVSVAGKVSEFFAGAAEDHNLSVTEIKAEKIKVISPGNKQPEAVKIGSEDGRLPPAEVIDDDAFSRFEPDSDGIDFWESLEGMLVTIHKAVVVEPRNSYGEVVVVPQEVLQRNVVSSEGALLQTESDANPERIVVELPSGYTKNINLGSEFSTPLTGVVDYEYGNYRVLEINSAQIENRDVQTETLEPVAAGLIRMGTYNLNNFNRFDEARTKKIARQIVKNMAAPDVLMLEEVQDDSGAEDDGTTSAQKNLSALINAILDLGGPEYAFADPPVMDGQNGGANGGNIRTVLLYRKEDGLELKGINPDQIKYEKKVFTGSRLPLICEMSYLNQPFYIIGVHFVSNNLNSPLFGSLQPIQKPEEADRIQQAREVAAIAEELQNTAGGFPVYILGDFNDVAFSTSLNQFTRAGFIDSSARIGEKERYSILFEGNAEQFDHVLFNQLFEKTINTAWILHLNTGYSEKNRVSDHDPVGVDLEFK